MLRWVAWLALSVVAFACSEERIEPEPEIPVRVGTVALDRGNAPVVILEEEDGPRILPIWIGAAEASSIASQIQHRRPPRPNFHDLAGHLIEQLGGRVERVVVTELRGNTYYAILHLEADGRKIEIDVRPSDGIAVALRARAPILVREGVFDAAGDELPTDEPGRPIRFLPRPALPAGTPPATPRLSL